MPSQGDLSSVFSLAPKMLYSTFKHLCLFECFLLQVQIVCKDDSHVPFCVCVYVTL